MISDPNLDAVLEGLLEPLTADRLSAVEALRLLRASPDEAKCVDLRHLAGRSTANTQGVAVASCCSATHRVPWSWCTCSLRSFKDARRALMC